MFMPGKNLLHLGLRPRLRVELHDHDVLHIRIPTVDDFALGLIVLGVGNALFTLEVAEQLIPRIPDRVVADAGVLEHLFQLRPDGVMPPLVLGEHAVLDRCLPRKSLHLTPLDSQFV